MRAFTESAKSLSTSSFGMLSTKLEGNRCDALRLAMMLSYSALVSWPSTLPAMMPAVARNIDMGGSMGASIITPSFSRSRL